MVASFRQILIATMCGDPLLYNTSTNLDHLLS